MPTLLTLAISNLLRRPVRTLVTALGVALAVAVLFCLVSFQRSYQAGLHTELDRLGAHLLVVPKGCPYDAASLALHGASWPCYLKAQYLTTVRNTPHVAAAAPVLMSAVYDENSGNQTVYCGVDSNILQLKHLWKIQGHFPNAFGQILAGSEAARLHHWNLGQTVALPGLGTSTGQIAGILKPTQGADDLFLYLPLDDARQLFHRPGQLTHILVRLDDPSSVDTVVTLLRGCDAGLDMNVVPLTHLFNTINAMVQNTRLLLGSVVLVALLAAGAGVSNTLLMAVAERTREIGILRAVGASQRDVFGMIWLETAVLCLIGGLGGVLLALGGAHVVEAWLRERLPFAPQDALVRPELGLFVLCMLGSLALGTVAALTPAWRAARLAPAEAIRV